MQNMDKLESAVKRPSIGGDEDAGFIPLQCINTFTNDWIIKAKVVKKGFREWKNMKGTGFLLNVDLMDKDGTQI